MSQVTGTLDAGPGPLAVLGTLAIMVPWVAAQWEEYHTGLMLYGNGYYGITEVGIDHLRGGYRPGCYSEPDSHTAGCSAYMGFKSKVEF